MGEFGNKFRKEREKKGISLDDVSNVTKIGSRMLQAIEEEHFEQLPGGVFNKGFIRAYAKHLGLNDEEAVNDYLACLRQAQIDAHEVWEPAASARTVAPKRGTAPYVKPAAQAQAQSTTQVEELPELQLPKAEHVRPPSNKYLSERSPLPWGLIAAGALVIVLALFLWIRHSRVQNTSQPGDQVHASPAPLTQPAASTPVSTATIPGAMPPSSHPASATASPSPTSTTPLKPASKPASGGTPAQQPALPPAPPASAQPAKAPSFVLVIRASENSWISVNADGQTVSEETLIAPAHASFRANREISVKVGNAAGVTFLWNGKEIPAQGAEAEAKTLVFDSNGLRSPQPVAAQPAPAP